MGLLDNIKSTFGRKGIVQFEGDWDKGGNMFSYGKSRGTPNLVELYKSAYSRVDLIARKVASLELEYTRVKSDVIVPNHAIINLFNDPSGINGDIDTDDFISSVVSSSLICDETFIIFEYAPNTKFPISMKVALPGSVTPIITNSIVDGYEYNNKKLENREYIRIAGWSPISRSGGISPLSTIKTYLTTEQMIAAHQIGVFENNAIPSGVLVIEANKLVFESVKEDWEQKHKGAGNNNKLAFVRKEPGATAAPIDYKQYSTDNKNLDLKVLFDRIDKKVDEAFGVPKQMMGDIEATNFAGVKLANLIFWDNVGTPHAKKIASKFNRWIKQTYPNDNIQINFITPEITDTEQQLTEAQTVKTKAETLNILVSTGVEARSAITELELPQGLVVANIQPTAKSVRKKNNKPTDYKSLISGKTFVTKQLSTDEYPEEYKQLKAVMTSHINQQYISVKDLEDPRQLDATNQTLLLSAALLPVIVKLYEKVGQLQTVAFLQEAGLPVSLGDFTLDGNFKTGLSAYTNRVASGFESETQKALIDYVNTANDLQWTASQKKVELRKYYKSQGEYVQQGGKLIKNNAQYRADRLVRTETVRANNQASLKSMQDISQKTNIVFEKVWRRRNTTPEAICDFYNGKVIGLYEPYAELGETIDVGDDKIFNNNFQTMHTPGAHPNCECYLEFRERQ